MTDTTTTTGLQNPVVLRHDVPPSFITFPPVALLKC